MTPKKEVTLSTVPPAPLFLCLLFDAYTQFHAALNGWFISTEARATVQANIEFAGGEKLYRRLMWRKGNRKAPRVKSDPKIWPLNVVSDKDVTWAIWPQKTNVTPLKKKAKDK
jgi:hypothetical protein